METITFYTSLENLKKLIKHPFFCHINGNTFIVILQKVHFFLIKCKNGSTLDLILCYALQIEPPKNKHSKTP